MPQTGTVGVFVAQGQNKKKKKNSIKMNLQVATNAVCSIAVTKTLLIMLRMAEWIDRKVDDLYIP